jgi:thioredoxin reductase
VSSTDVEVAVVGAGPYGLSIAAHLAGRGVERRVFGRPMGSWIEHMPAGMLLKSEPYASNLSDPGGRFTLRAFAEEHGLAHADAGAPLAVERFTAYGTWFQRRAVPDVEDVRVTGVARRDHGFEVSLDTGERFRARSVVVATGIAPFACRPAAFDGVGRDLVSHTSAHRDLDRFRGLDVTVVGAGQSALETATLLFEHGARPRLVARAPGLAWNRVPSGARRSSFDKMRCPPAPLCGCGWECAFWSYGQRPFQLLPPAMRHHVVRSTFGPAGAWWLRDRFDHVPEVHLGTTVVAATPSPGGLVLALQDAGGATNETSTTRRVETQHVILGTGYRVDVGLIPFLAPELGVGIRRNGGYPVLTRFLESSVPGLHFAGMTAAVELGPSMRFVFGCDHAARMVTHRLAGHRTGGRRARAGGWVPAGPARTPPPTPGTDQTSPPATSSTSARR